MPPPLGGPVKEAYKELEDRHILFYENSIKSKEMKFVRETLDPSPSDIGTNLSNPDLV